MSEQAVFNALKYRIEVDDDGSRRYYNTNGELHRTDGPAVEWSNGVKFWYHNDRLHRTDGPAVEWANGHNEWWINGVILTEAEFNQRVKMPEQDDFDSVKYRIEADEVVPPWYTPVVTYTTKLLALC